MLKPNDNVWFLTKWDDLGEVIEPNHALKKPCKWHCWVIINDLWRNQWIRKNLKWHLNVHFTWFKVGITRYSSSPSLLLYLLLCILPWQKTQYKLSLPRWTLMGSMSPLHKAWRVLYLWRTERRQISLKWTHDNFSLSKSWENHSSNFWKIACWEISACQS